MTGMLINPYRFTAGGGGGGYSAEVLADSPLAYYRLGEAAGTTMTDSSGNGRDGTYTGTPTLGATGLISGDTDTCVDFDGIDDYGDVATAAWMNVTTLTLECVFNADSVSSDRQLLDRDGSARLFQFRLSGSNLQFLFWTSGGGPYAATGSTTITAGAKYHAAATFDGTTARVYLNGTQDGSAAVSGTMATGSVNLAVGVSRGGTPVPQYQRFDGRIDEAAYYGSALSAARIAAHAAAV